MLNLAKIAAGLLLALALALGLYAWTLARAPAAVAPVAEMAQAGQVKLVVAAKAIAAGQVLAEQDLQLQAMAQRPDGAFDTVASAVGQVAAVEVPQGAAVLSAQMVHGLATRVNEGERAVAVKVDENIGAGHRIRPGDFVDVFFVLRRDGTEIEQSQARLLLSRKRVLAYGGASVEAMVASDGQRPDEARAANASGAAMDSARTAVLAVPVEEVSRLALGSANGNLLLALRNPADLAEPDAQMFAPLSGALDVLVAKNGTAAQRLHGADAAQAGVTMAALAGARSAAPKAVITPPVYRAGSPAARKPRAAATAVVEASHAVEYLRGARVETLNY